MALDFSEFFKEYEALVAEVDTIFEKVSTEHSDCVTCGLGCSDCCYALFDLSLIEAMYINHKFLERFSGMDKANIVDRADTADRQTYKFKRDIFKASQGGSSTAEIMRSVAETRIKCPLLDENEKCSMYDARPITCRLYGIPTAIGNEGHTCGKSKFEQGASYPTVNMDRIQDRLIEMSGRMVSAMNTKHTSLHEVLVPLSMAIITKYDKDYLGLKDESGCDGSGTVSIAFGGEDGKVTVEQHNCDPSECSSCGQKESCTSSDKTE